MSKKRRQNYSGCSVESHCGQLRLRFRVVLPDGTKKHVAHRTGYLDTPENRRTLTPLAKLVGATVAAGKTVGQVKSILAASLNQAPPESEMPTVPTPITPTGPTVAEYYATWIKEQLPVVRRAQGRDYKRHVKGYVLPVLGKVPLGDLRSFHVRGLQAELLEQEIRRRDGSVKKRSVKHAKSIVAGSFQAMIQQARVDELVTRDLFAGLKWPHWSPPDPDPFAADEVRRILAWFKARRFGFHPGPSSMSNRFRPHPAYHGYVQLLFLTGMRPSEASGLWWVDIDLARRRLHIRRSRHLYEYGAPKTASARRTVELPALAVETLSALQPLHVTPEMPVFTGTTGKPIEPKAFAHHWYDCLRALGLRQRGIYTCKDTFVSRILQAGAKIAWLEQQTGVSYATLRRHYGRWMPTDNETELHRLEPIDPDLFAAGEAKLSPIQSGRGGQFPKKPRGYYAEGVRGGGLEDAEGNEKPNEIKKPRG